jgi:hypothetical protein
VDQSWIDQHQTIVAGLIAFAGVTFGLGVNALLQWLDRRSKRIHDQQVMRSALLAEMTFLLRSLESRVQSMSVASGSFDIPMVTETEVYDRLLERIGVLEPEQGDGLIHAYLAAKHLSADVRWIVAAIAPSADVPAEVLSKLRCEPDPHEDQIRVPPWAIPEVVRVHWKRIDLLKAAITALKG